MKTKFITTLIMFPLLTMPIAQVYAAVVDAVVVPDQSVVTPDATADRTNNTVTPKQDAPNGDQDSDSSTPSSTTPLNASSATAPTKPIEQAAPTIANGSAQQTNGTRSVVFRDEELQAVADAVRLYESKKKGGQKGATDVSGNVYLNSIIHNAESQWTAWVNGSKVKSTKISNNLTLINVSQEKAFFKWVMVDIDNAAPGWRTKATEIGDNHYKINDHPVEVSIVNNNVGVVNFALQVNQTFIPQLLSVVEGRIYSGAPAQSNSNTRKAG